MTESREELAAKIDLADWSQLRAHLERGGVIVVDPLLELAEVGVGVASDDVKSLERWIAAGLVSKPSAPQMAAWDAEKGKRLLCLIVSPYVLVREESPEKG